MGFFPQWQEAAMPCHPHLDLPGVPPHMIQRVKTGTEEIKFDER